jgi:hypothetical protein
MQNRKQNRKWLRLISESYVQMNEMEELNPYGNPTEFGGGYGPLEMFPSDDPFARSTRGTGEQSDFLSPQDVEALWQRYLELWQRTNPGTEIPPGLYNDFVQRLIRWYESGGEQGFSYDIMAIVAGAGLGEASVRVWVRNWLITLTGAMALGPGATTLHIGALIAYLTALGFSVAEAYDIAERLWNGLQQYLNDLSRDPNVPKIPKEMRRNFDLLIPRPAPDPQIAPSMLPPGHVIPMLPGQQYPGQHPIGPNGLPYIPVSTPSGSYPPGSSTPERI